MSQTSTRPAVAPSHTARRIVLFGMPDAGKSSLLGALAQAAQMQELLLKARLIDKSQGLVELQRRLYEERPRETLEEIVPYLVAVEPLDAKMGLTQTPGTEVLLVDCDGRVANEILARSAALDGSPADGALARSIRDADTLILVIDASSDHAARRRDFAQFAQFLHLLQQGRGRRSEIGGLPVYLVLTKCDLLAQKDDSTHGWMERIEERKRAVHKSFEEFLTRESPAPIPFGKIDLHVWATAVKRPALADSPAKPREPYGVAELFRQCFASAGRFQERRARANQRLTWTLTAVAAVVAVMLLFALILIVSQPAEEATALADDVRQFRAANPPDRPTERFRGPLDDKLNKLQGFEKSPYFTRLDQDLKTYVTKALTELKAFQSYAEQLKEISDRFNNDLNKVKDEEQLRTVKAELEKVTLKEQFKSDWSEVKEVRRQQKWLDQIAVIEKEAQKLRIGYEKLVEDAKKVEAMVLKIAIPLVQDHAKEVLSRARKLPSKTDQLPGVAEEVTYEVVYRLESVARVHRDWEPLHKSLQKIVELLKMP